MQGELFGDIGRRKRRVGAAPGPEYHVPKSQRASRKRWLVLHKDQLNQYQKNYRRANRTTLTRKKLAANKTAKLEGIAAYGGKCACCGESRIEFLTLDHIHGRASEPRRITGLKAWARLKARGWPKDNYQLLCFNCNWAKGAYGHCPHQDRRDDDRK
jgi:5-methylcytosine-specific restriction endonuclease McrA